jgi:CP family cyanate transporter-like MFS transporter
VPEPSTPGPRTRRIAVGLGLLLVSFNLRPSIAAISPILAAIRRSTGLSATGAGLLTTLPLICFGLLAPVAPRLVRRRGTGTVLLGCLVVLLVGIVVRSTSYVGLFAGTLLIGTAVAIANVLMPAIVKSDFPQQVGLMTGLYTMMLSAGAALAAGATAPLARALGGNWRLAAGAWAVPVVVAIGVIVPIRARGRRAPEVRVLTGRTRTMWRSPVAWSVTVFMGVQSLEFYSALAWLPTVFHDRGVSVVNAGLLLALSNAVGIVAALVTPWIVQRLADVRVAVLGSVAFFVVGTLGLLVDPRHLDALWAVLLGCGQGSAISLALMIMVLRSRNAHEAMALSGMAQGVGYLIASIGPASVGALYDVAHDWSLPLSALLALLVVQGVAGSLAARDRVALGP